MEYRKYKIIHTARANFQLNSIYSYIKDVLLNPIAADQFYVEYFSHIQILQFLPSAFPKYINENYHYLIFKNWIIIYKIYDSTVKIQTIINSKQNSNDIIL